MDIQPSIGKSGNLELVVKSALGKKIHPHNTIVTSLIPK